MAYEPKTWQYGEVVTADDLNRIERGIAEAGGGLILKVSETVDSKMYFDHTWEEVDNAMKAGTPVNVLQKAEIGDSANKEAYTFFAPVISTHHITNGKTSPPTETFEAYIAYIPPSSDSVVPVPLKADSADGRLYTGA